MIGLIQPRKFYPRRWELTRFWMKEIERNPRRASGYEDDGLTDEQRRAMYEHFKALDMVEPTTRAAWNKWNWEAKRSSHERRVKRVHVDKFFRFRN